MNKKMSINTLQLFSLIVLFELGSAILLDVAKDAKKDAWITLLLGTILGIGIYFLYYTLHRFYPDLPFTLYIQKIWGPHIGWIIGILYIVYFINIAGRVLRDFTELLIITAYPYTSIFIIGILMMSSISYGISKNLQVMGRVSFLCLTGVGIVVLIIIFGEAFSGLIDIRRNLPILENGWKPIFKTLSKTITTPFGELIAFTMLFPFVDKKVRTLKTGIFAIIVSGGYLAFSSILHLAVLGESIAFHSTFPVLSAVSFINIANFFTRITALVVIAMVLLGFIKISIFFYCAVLGTSHLFKIKNKNTLIIPISILILYSSIVDAESFNEHTYEGLKIVPYYMHIPFQFIIPLLLLLTVLLKNKLNKF